MSDDVLMPHSESPARLADSSAQVLSEVLDEVQGLRNQGSELTQLMANSQPTADTRPAEDEQ